ncbi:Uncharacterised protein [Micrococcus luteus]|nr:Uncharacterised protein [Micrococcus luteus]
MAFDRWVAADGPEDAPIVWRKPSWEKALAHVTPVRELLGGWPADLKGDPLTREKVTESAGKVTADDRAAQLTAFLAAMVWGYGRVGYGPSRVAKMLAEPRFLDDLAELTRVTLAEGGVAGYQRVRDARYGEPRDRGFLKHLGPAFGTKYIYFLTKAQPVEGQVAPVLDSVVRMWFRKNVDDEATNVEIGAGWGYAERYATYVKTMQAWAEKLGIAADDVERLIFASRQAEVGGGWAESWSDASPASAQELLEHLGVQIAAVGLQDEAETHLEAIADLLAETTDDDADGPAHH